MASSIPALSAGILAANDTRGCPRRDRDRGGGSVRKPGPVLSGIPPPKPPRRGGVPLPFVAGIVDDEYENRRVKMACDVRVFYKNVGGVISRLVPDMQS